MLAMVPFETILVFSYISYVVFYTVSTDTISVLNKYCPSANKCRRSESGNEANVTDAGTSQCLACSCDPFCKQKGNCCPEKADLPRGGPLSLSDRTGENEMALDFTCMIPRTNIAQENGQGISVIERLGVYMVTSCKQGAKDRRCTQPKSHVLDENLPQTSVNTSVTYRNVYCGLCNDDTVLEPWRPFVTCSDSYLLKADQNLFPISVEKLFQQVVYSENGKCGVEFRPPDNLKESRDMCYTADLNRTCPSYNVLIQGACESFTMPYFYSENAIIIVYANVFCFLCQNNTEITNNHFNEILKFPTISNDLIGELNVGKENERKIEELSFQAEEIAKRYDRVCESGFIFDPYEENCRQWFCPTNHAVSDGACVPILKKVESATYQVSLTVTAENETEGYFKTLNKTKLTSSLMSAMFKNGVEATTEILLIAAGNDTGLSWFVVFLLHIHTTGDGTALLRTDAFSRTHIIKVNSNQTVLLRVELAIGVMVEIVTHPFWHLQILDLLAAKPSTAFHVSDNFLKIYEYPVLKKLQFCLQILLDRYEFADLIGSVRLWRSGISLYTGEFIRVPGSRNIRVCYDDYVKLSPGHYSGKDTPRSLTRPQVIASIVCTSMSISCLAMTILTYAVFSELRSIPGKNNILLATHLLIAQCLYQFTFSIQEHPDLCVVFGMLSHFFWLTTIFWMSVCTIHMFRTFVTKQSVRSKGMFDPQICVYAVYCYVLSAVFVAVNIGVSLKQSGGSSLGYGGNICYISSPFMVGMTFTLPVGIIVFLNMLFFFIVVFKISESTMRQGMQSCDRTNSVIYMKLSTLTGITWIFGYIYIWTDFAPLEFVFIILNAGQGVFIFVSFVCNAKIFRLYRELFRKYGRQFRRFCCSEKVELPRAKDKEAVKKCSNISGSSNKTHLSETPIENSLHFSPDLFPASLTDVEPGKENGSFEVGHCEMDGVLNIFTSGNPTTNG